MQALREEACVVSGDSYKADRAVDEARALITQAQAIRLTRVQDRSVRMIDEEGEYAANDRGNYYHPYHRPGNFYVDYRTADVLVRLGLAERRYGRLFRTALGTAYHRNVKRPD